MGLICIDIETEGIPGADMRLEALVNTKQMTLPESQ